MLNRGLEGVFAQLQDHFTGHPSREPLADEVEAPGGDTQQQDATNH